MIGGMLVRAKLKRILAIMDKERELLLSGEIIKIGALVGERDEQIAALSAADGLGKPEFRALLADIKKKAERNAKLLEAARDGVRDAEALLGEINAKQSRLGAYGIDGTATRTANVSPRHERRA